MSVEMEADAQDSLLADEQAALRRVATAAAKGASPADVFAVVSDELLGLLGLPWVELVRFGNGVATVVCATGRHPFRVDSRWMLDEPSVASLVFATGAPSRIDDYSGLPGSIAEVARGAGILGAIGAPVVVDGVTWGALVAFRIADPPIPADAEARLGPFAELVAIAISNVESRDALRNLAGEHAALRRVATLVAEGARRSEVFTAVAKEAVELLHVSGALLAGFERDRTAVVLAASSDPDWGAAPGVAEVGSRWPADAGTIWARLHEEGRAVRSNSSEPVLGSAAAAPITVNGELWGAVVVFSREGGPLPYDTEGRLQGFTELVGTAVSNAAARDELIASRARLVAAGDEARRRIERDLHDGTQQRLIALGLDLQRVRGQIATDPSGAGESLGRMEEDLYAVLEEIRELSSSLHPPLLSRRGFVAALRALARRSPIPVDIDVDLRDRPPPAIETALYYVASESLTNAIKHSQASRVSVSVETDHVGWPFGIGLDGRRGVGNVYATITDDGIGGADATAGSGLSGLTDRVDALGGRLTVDSPSGAGTRISIVLPLDPDT